MLLSAHDYSIEYRSATKHGNADGLSRLPLPALAEIDEDYTECFYFEQFQTLPVTAVEISRKTRKDKFLSRVFAAVLRGNWTVSKNLKLFFEKRNELPFCQDCLVWGPKVVTPEVLRGTLLNELHFGHLGIVKMKKVARSFAWWPGIDRNIEILVKSCKGCLQTGKKPSPVSLHFCQMLRDHGNGFILILRDVFRNHGRRQGGAAEGHGSPWIFKHSLFYLSNFKNSSIFSC